MRCCCSVKIFKYIINKMSPQSKYIWLLGDSIFVIEYKNLADVWLSPLDKYRTEDNVSSDSFQILLKNMRVCVVNQKAVKMPPFEEQTEEHSINGKLCIMPVLLDGGIAIGMFLQNPGNTRLYSSMTVEDFRRWAVDNATEPESRSEEEKLVFIQANEIRNFLLAKTN